MKCIKAHFTIICTFKNNYVKCNGEVIQLPGFVGFVEESNAECLTLPDNGKLVFKAAEAAALGTASEG